MRVVAISDTHGMHDQLTDLPPGDVLIFAGDLTSRGEYFTIERFNKWLKGLDYEYKIIIAGNHDKTFESDPEEARARLTEGIYLQDSGVQIEGILFYGSPWQPEFNDWSFNLPRGPKLQEKWDLIPKNTDVLITHGPPLHYGDTVFNVIMPQGCMDLLDAIRRIKPAVHVCGHIHEGYGIRMNKDTLLINASNLDEYYRLVNDPIVFDIVKKNGKVKTKIIGAGYGE